ncbi:TAFII28-domain-containing protein [Neoconidiobolus thromboides FSU 785]|nr:TAFII28-domain-containing protein [Neoconidiobolus thromboides FSU 785]
MSDNNENIYLNDQEKEESPQDNQLLAQIIMSAASKIPLNYNSETEGSPKNRENLEIGTETKFRNEQEIGDYDENYDEEEDQNYNENYKKEGGYEREYNSEVGEENIGGNVDNEEGNKQAYEREDTQEYEEKEGASYIEKNDKEYEKDSGDFIKESSEQSEEVVTKVKKTERIAKADKGSEREGTEDIEEEDEVERKKRKMELDEVQEGMIDEEEEDDEDLGVSYIDTEQSSKVRNSGRSNAELRALIEAFDPEQLKRYEVFRRAALNKGTVKKVVSSMINQPFAQNLSMVVAGFSKVFIGEIVELALEVQKEWDQNEIVTNALQGKPFNIPRKSPLLPEHLREAYRRYLLNHRISNSFYKKPKILKR